MGGMGEERMRIKEDLKSLYDKDYPLWVERNLEFLQKRRYDEIDWENLLEEIKDMGRRDLDACISYLAVILEHLYKWDHYRHLTKGGVKKGGKGWVRSIRNARWEIELLFEESPSLKKMLPKELPKAWKKARIRIVKSIEILGEEKISLEDIPLECPYTYEEALYRDVWGEWEKRG